MGDFVREQAPSAIGVRREFTSAKKDIPPDGEGAGVHGFSERARAVVVMNANTRKTRAKAWLHEAARRLGQRRTPARPRRLQLTGEGLTEPARRGRCRAVGRPIELQFVVE